MDLDGTLLNSDILHETFWNAFALDWKVPLKVLAKSFSGKARLKDYLSQASDLDLSTLPYNQKVIEYIKSHRSKGGRTALVTATNHSIAKNIANYLGLFDEVHGSSAENNLKGRNKAKFLVRYFGKNRFNYMGDSYADLPVWKEADKAITVNAGEQLKTRCQHINKNWEHLKEERNNRIVSLYVKAFRVHQWVKNILVFLPLVAAHRFGYTEFLSGIIAFFSFCIIASSVYIVNDLLDLNADRAHPRKCFRPFAAGNIPILHGMLMAPIFFTLGLLIASFVDYKLLIVALIYYSITTAYSLFLKQKPIIDVFTLAGLYTIRIIAGGVATNTEFTFWLLSFSITIFLSLAAVKRQAELVDAKKHDKAQIKKRGYFVSDLPIVTMIAVNSGFLSVLILAFYINSPNVIALYKNPAALWGICGILLFWICRIIYITNIGKMNDDPIVYALRNNVSRICFLAVLFFIYSASNGWFQM